MLDSIALQTLLKYFCTQYSRQLGLIEGGMDEERCSKIDNIGLFYIQNQ